VIRYGHIAWRVAAVAAFAGTAALAVTLTRASARPQAGLSSKVTCSSSGLQAWLGLGSGSGTGPTTGSAGNEGTQDTYYTLEFTNVSHRTCRLYGYPEVSAYATGEVAGAQGTGTQETDAQGADAQGTGAQGTGAQGTDAHGAGGQIGDAAIPDTAVRPQSVTLPPGATAHAVLRIASTGSTKPSACAQVMAQEIRVIPPGQGLSRAGATVFDVHIPVCAARGHTSLSVQPVLARPGIPGRALPDRKLTMAARCTEGKLASFAAGRRCGQGPALSGEYRGESCRGRA
jgi:hypothetical protein